MKKNLLTLGSLALTAVITASSITGCGSGISFPFGNTDEAKEQGAQQGDDTDSKDADNKDADNKDADNKGTDSKNSDSQKNSDQAKDNKDKDGDHKNSTGKQSTDPDDFDYSQDYFGFSFYFNATSENGYDLSNIDIEAKKATKLPEKITEANFICYDAFDGNDSEGSEYIITKDQYLDLKYINNLCGNDYCFRGYVDGEDEFYSALDKLEYFDPTKDEEWELDGGILNYGILFYEDNGETYWIYTTNIFGFDYFMDYDAEYEVISDQKELDAITEMVNSHEYNGFVSQEFININELNWFLVFYAGAGIFEPVTDEDELNAYLEAVGWEELYCGDLFRFNRVDVEKYLSTHVGISSSFKGYEDAFEVYLEEYDAYYVTRSEEGLNEYKCISAKRCGNRVYARLAFTGYEDDQRMFIIEDSYSCDRVVSNTYIK